MTYTFRYRLSVFLLFAILSALYTWGFIIHPVLWRMSTPRGRVISIGSILLWIVFTAVFAFSILERVVVTETELRRRSWHGRQAVRWSTVNFIKIDAENKILKLGQRKGTRIDVSLFLDGLSVIADKLERDFGVPVQEALGDLLPTSFGQSPNPSLQRTLPG